MASFNVIRATTTSFVVEVSGLDTSYAYTRDFYWYVSWKDSGSSESYWRLMGSTLGVAPDSTSVTFIYRGIAWGYPGTQFYFAVDIFTGGTEDRLLWLTTSGTSASSGPVLSAQAAATTITATVTSLPFVSTDRYVYWREWYYSPQYFGGQTITSGASSASFTYTGLSPATTYGISAQIYKVGDTSDDRNFIDILYLYVTTSSSENFEWDYAGCTASGVPITGSQKNSDYRVYVSAAEWNRLVDCTNDLMGTSIGHVNPGMRISAAIFNQIANALGALPVSAGDYIMASAFNRLSHTYNVLLASPH